MKITDIRIRSFRTYADSWDRDHGVPLPKAESIQTVTTIETDEGVSGHYFGGGMRGDLYGLSASEQEVILGRVKSLIVGQDPMDRELIWKWFWVAANIPENIGSVIDNALWDLAGNAAGLPVYKLMGGARDRVKAYASSHKNMGQPEDYAAHALDCKNKGYLAYKIHPHYFWNPDTRQPTPGRPSNIRADIETCRAVRDAVGPDYVLMFDPWGTYMTMEEALLVGRELERLNFYWYEHPMPETRPEMYVRLCRELTIPILSPEIAAGGVFTRADWILRGASDMTRIDTHRGGITGARKTCIVAEAYGQRCELHMSGWGNLHVMGATHEDTSEYYEKGLLAPGVDNDIPHPYLKVNCDVVEPDGYITLPKGPGLGYQINWDYIEDNLV
ncbi:enolase C-terminal domain-like protein [Frigidibacter sp. ROC022]|uniref:enolase C-terminal domain-like protein n=1 Tax=Frigidibacter sp. ROC022 TaxID=2971796 RepID=UPI00215A2BB9|nr:enolase C-terminal domain-like protein [Frigidibacter sp. ROC022]MCR8724668.1 hypothetical protein [Frigidibacter sp. ROC022]